MKLDVPTLFVAVTLLSLLTAVWVCVMAWGQPSREALWAWGAALLSFFAGNLLFALQGHAPDPLPLISGNLACAASLALMQLALWRFQLRKGLGLRGLLPLALVPLFGLLFANQQRVLLGLFTLLFVVQIGLILGALLDPAQKQHGRGRYILLITFGAVELMLLARLLAVVLGWERVGSGVELDQWQAMVFIATLAAVISVTLGFVYMIMERAELRNFELAMKDMLTGLSNRRAISDQLHAAVARAQRQGQLLSVLMMDIDHFKRINDSYGHQAGDRVLHGIAQTLSSRLRAQDQIGRFGGEEFLVVLPDTGLDGALILAEALRAAVEATPTQWGVHSIAATISIGVRGGVVTGADTADGLVGAADAAMYQAKAAGRNRVEQSSR
ncbi:diguanylate cyclase (GGDEF)-like protein [Paucibacter oligotrophus]|uniref:diguanylate cyclase n=1 Tax=Roseateles oligotrophus TaxID=1769250 RepID=A0A840LER6_9BURK|nr:GGDEF domain-containing protein [Roseateles oligotrophus]MBB4844688.1 diguanylate cyclase (GGDEF)-like protein [Roseateles oligotrophus]